MHPKRQILILILFYVLPFQLLFFLTAAQIKLIQRTLKFLVVVRQHRLLPLLTHLAFRFPDFMLILFAPSQFCLCPQFIVANLELREDFVDNVGIAEGGPVFLQLLMVVLEGIFDVGKLLKKEWIVLLQNLLSVED